MRDGRRVTPTWRPSRRPRSAARRDRRRRSPARRRRSGRGPRRRVLPRSGVDVGPHDGAELLARRVDTRNRPSGRRRSAVPAAWKRPRPVRCREADLPDRGAVPTGSRHRSAPGTRRRRIAGTTGRSRRRSRLVGQEMRARSGGPGRDVAEQPPLAAGLADRRGSPGENAMTFGGRRRAAALLLVAVATGSRITSSLSTSIWVVTITSWWMRVGARGQRGGHRDRVGQHLQEVRARHPRRRARPAAASTISGRSGRRGPAPGSPTAATAPQLTRRRCRRRRAARWRKPHLGAALHP